MRLRFAGWVALALAQAGCAHVPRTPHGPEAVARDFAQALSEGRLDAAFGLSSGLARPDFEARYQDGAARAARASAVLAAADAAGAGAQVQLAFGPGGWRVLELPFTRDDAQAKQALAAFLDAAERRDFSAAWAMLSARWRARYTPARLGQDFDAEPRVRDRLQRARAALAGPWQVGPDAAALPLGEGRALRLEREGELYRVAALE